MSIKDKTTPSQSESLEFELELGHPPEKVWRALTTPELLTEWLLPVVGFDLTKGTAFNFQAPPQPGWNGKVDCSVLEVDTHRMIRWSWVVGELDTVVTFTLTPTDAGTRLSLVQSGFTEKQKKNFGGARYGWRMMGKRLIDRLARSS